VDVFSPPADRAAAWAAKKLPGKYGISIFGRIRPQKGTKEFVEAAIEVLHARPAWTAVIVGETTPEFRIFEQQLRAKIDAAGLSERVHFTGFLPRFSDIPEWYRASSVVVCASHNEGFGLSGLEAMASGCPVVATRTGAWPELIEDGVDGFLVACADTRSLADALLRITSAPEKVGEMGQRARAKVLAHHGIAHEAAGLREVYRALLKKSGSSLP
jgi:glycosyltransferase involved in cell wall biosynthesis